MTWWKTLLSGGYDPPVGSSRNSLAAGVGGGISGTPSRTYTDTRNTEGIFGAFNNAADTIRDTVGGVGESLQEFLERAAAQQAARQAAPPVAAPAIDPMEQTLRQIMNIKPVFDAASYKRDSQKAINSAILGARGSYDAEIADTRTGLKEALGELTKYEKAFGKSNAPTRGNAQARAQARGQQVSAEADQASASLQADIDAAARQYGGGIQGGASAQQAARAGDLAQTVIAGRETALTKDAQRASTATGQLASDVGDWSRANAQEQSGRLTKDANRQIARLRRERAAAIAQARAQAQLGIADNMATAQTGAVKAAQDQQDLLLRMLDMRERSRLAELDQRTKTQPDLNSVLDDFRAMNEAQTKKAVGKKADGTPVFDFTPTYDAKTKYEMLVLNGLPPQTAAQITGYDPNKPQNEAVPFLQDILQKWGV